MNLNILTSGLITAKFGIRPALMCATRKDLSAHSVVRIVSDTASGWIGIAYGHLITGAKCQAGEQTLNGFEALSAFMKLESGVFDLIQMDNRLLGDELAQSIGISIDELLEQLKNNPQSSTIEILRKCKRTNDAITMLMATEADSKPMKVAGMQGQGDEGDEEDLDWELGDEGVIESLERQTRVGRKKTSETEMQLFASDKLDAPLPDEMHGSLLETDAVKEGDPQAAPAAPERDPNAVPMLDSLAADWGTQEPPDPLKSSKPRTEKILEDTVLPEAKSLFSESRIDPDETVDRIPAFTPTPQETKQAELSPSTQAAPSNHEPATTPINEAPPPHPDAVKRPAAAREAQVTDGVEIARIRELSKNQEAAFEVGSIDEVKNSRDGGGFVIVSQGDQQFLPPAVVEGQPVSEDRLGAELRAELQEFVRQKFGVEESFQSVDIEESKDYQESLVLRDLERSIEKARGDESAPRLKPTHSIEKPVVPNEPPGRSTLQKLKSQAQTQSSSFPAAALNPTESRPKPPTSKQEIERESSRNIFVEQVRKSVEVDAKSFVSAQNTDSKLEISILKDKRTRNFIIASSSIGLVLAGGIFVFFSAERQSLMSSASEKLVAQDYKGAKEAYEKILEQNPESWEAHLGHALAMPDDYKQQVVDYKKVLAIRPTEFSAAAALSKAYFELKQYDKAIEAADLAYKLKPNPSSLKMKANSLLKLGRYEDASKTLLEALDSDTPNKGELHFMLSTCYKELKNSKGQSACLAKALELEPRNPVYAKELALLHIANKGNAAKSRSLLENAIAITPSDGELHYQLALQIKDKESGKAIEELTFAIEHGYAKPEAFAERGMLYYANRQFGPAKPDLEEALDKKDDPRWRKTLDQTDRAINLAKARAGTRQLEDSSAGEMSFAQLPSDYMTKAYNSIGSNPTYAISLLKTALHANPNDARARRYLALAFFNAGEYVGAANQFAYVARQGLSAEEQYMYGKSLSRSDRLENAIEVLKNLVAQQPQYTKARMELVKAYSKAGFRDHAREECQIGMQQARNQADYTEFKALMP